MLIFYTCKRHKMRWASCAFKLKRDVIVLIVVLLPLCIQPKAFQIVKFALFPVEDMHDNIYVVNEGPLLTAFGMIGFLVGLAGYCVNYRIGNRFNLNITLCFAEDEKVGNGFVNLPKVEAYYLLSFLLLDSTYYCLKQLTGARNTCRRLFATLKGGDDFLQMNT